MKVFINHGMHGGPESAKVQPLRKAAVARDCPVETPDYRTVRSPEDRVRFLLKSLEDPDEAVVLAGASMGGYVSVVAGGQCRAPVAGLFLLAPALYLSRYRQQEYSVAARKTCVIHGWRDEVVAPENSIRFARENRAELFLVNDDHQFGSSLDWIEKRFGEFLDEL
jgi:pimeloyl-ACP methyl ester carboxylesterase